MIGIGLAIILIAGVAMLLFLTGAKTGGGKAGQHDKKPSLDLELVKNRWHDINTQQKSPSGMKNALVEADKLLDYVMRTQGAAGDTMAERLKHSEKRLSNKEAVWQAHKLRNHLSHEVGFEVVSSHAHEAIAAYGRALKDLGALR